MSASPKTAASPIKFGTSGWRGLIADDFTFATVRLAVTAIADHINAKTKNPTVLVGYDTRFYSEEFSQLAVEILQQHKIRTLLCDTFTPTPAVAYEIMRRKLDGAINFTASHNPAQYHGLKFSTSDAGPALPEVVRSQQGRKIVERKYQPLTRHEEVNYSGCGDNRENEQKLFVHVGQTRYPLVLQCVAPTAFREREVRVILPS